MAAQIAGILRGSGLRLRPFLLLRLVHAICSGSIVPLFLHLFPQAVAVFSSTARPVPIANTNTPLLTICLVMMSALLLLQTQPLIQKGAQHLRSKER